MLRRAKPKTAKELGARAEEHAARYLASRGYTIRARNYRLPRGPELDIVAEKKDVLVFVEVKSLRPAEGFNPGDHVDTAKQRQITRAAMMYISTVERRERVMRFDIVEVYLTETGRVQKIEHLEGAFTAK